MCGVWQVDTINKLTYVWVKMMNFLVKNNGQFIFIIFFSFITIINKCDCVVAVHKNVFF